MEVLPRFWPAKCVFALIPALATVGRYHDLSVATEPSASSINFITSRKKLGSNGQKLILLQRKTCCVKKHYLEH